MTDRFPGSTPRELDPWNATSPGSSVGNIGGWDRGIAHQLGGLSKESPIRSGLQHERPVTMQPPRRSAQATRAVYDGLDLDDLQNFLSWDMYGIRDMGDLVSNDETEEDLAHSWAGAI